MKLPTKNILFTDESRATQDETDNWLKEWVVFGHQRPAHIRYQQGGGCTMIRAGIINEQNCWPSTRIWWREVIFSGLLQSP